MESRLRDLLVSREGRSSETSGGNVGDSAAGELGSDHGIPPLACVVCGRRVSSNTSRAASALTRRIVGRVFLTNWVRVILDSISARCRSVLRRRTE